MQYLMCKQVITEQFFLLPCPCVAAYFRNKEIYFVEVRRRQTQDIKYSIKYRPWVHKNISFSYQLIQIIEFLSYFKYVCRLRLRFSIPFPSNNMKIMTVWYGDDRLNLTCNILDSRRIWQRERHKFNGIRTRVCILKV